MVDVFTTLILCIDNVYGWLMLLPIIVVADLIAICFVAHVVTTLYYLLLAFNSKVTDVIAIVCG